MNVLSIILSNIKICTMKKISTQLFLLAFSVIVFAGCSKQVKAPVKKAQTTSSMQPTTTTQTTNQNQGGHTCGGDHTSSGGNGY
jgi:hypothetical protein